jgi:hypothetical protein
VKTRLEEDDASEEGDDPLQVDDDLDDGRVQEKKLSEVK